MEKVKIYTFDIQPYRLKLWVGVTDDFSLLRDYFEHVDGRAVSLHNAENKGAVTTVVLVNKKTRRFGIVVLINKGETEIRTISHEATHVGQHVWDYVGEEMIGDEANAYLVGWAAECIGKVIKAYG